MVSTGRIQTLLTYAKAPESCLSWPDKFSIGFSGWSCHETTFTDSTHPMSLAVLWVTRGGKTLGLWALESLAGPGNEKLTFYASAVVLSHRAAHRNTNLVEWVVCVCGGRGFCRSVALLSPSPPLPQTRAGTGGRREWVDFSSPTDSSSPSS